MFTSNQIEEIRRKLQLAGAKDTSFPQAEPLKGNEIIALVQSGINVQIPVKEFVDKTVSWLAADYLNLSKIQDTSYTLQEAIELISPINRNIGQTITFKDSKGEWNIYQFRGRTYEDWNTLKYWINIKDSLKGIIEDFIGEANGVAPLDENKLVPSEYLPSYVDDVLEGYYKSATNFTNTSNVSYTPERSKIYVDISTSPSKCYRWSGSQYVLIANPLAIGTTKGTAYDGASGQKNATDIADLKSRVTELEGSEGSNVSFTAAYTTGTKIGTITINGVSTDIYIPIWNGTKAQYDAITTKNSNFIYNITD